MTLIITLIAIGILLLAIELIITPGFGLPGILGLLSIIGGVVLSFAEYGHTTGLIVLACVIVSLSFFTWLLLQSKTWKKIALTDSILSRTDSAPSEKGLEKGQKGKTLSRLAPAGKARFNEIDTEVWSQSGMIAGGSLIEIVDIQENKIIVKQIDQ